MASIEKRTTSGNGKTTYRVKVRLKGYPTQTATFHRLTDAKKWIQDTESAIRDGRHFKTTESKKHTFDNLLNRYFKEILPEYNKKEQQERRSKLAWWRTNLGPLLLADISTAKIREIRNNLSGKAPATVDKYLKNLSHAFSIAVSQWGWLEENPVTKVKSPKLPPGRARFLDDDERTRFLKACNESTNDYLYICIIIALSTGMRQGELMGLKWQDINLNGGYLVLHKTKNDERRRVAIVGHAFELLQEHSKLKRLDIDLLFPGKIPGKPIDLRKPFETALKQTEINDFTWHDLRHSAASYLAMNGASLPEIAEFLGHKTMEMVKRYAHFSDSHVSSVVASMNAKIFG